MALHKNDDSMLPKVINYINYAWLEKTGEQLKPNLNSVLRIHVFCGMVESSYQCNYGQSF